MAIVTYDSVCCLCGNKIINKEIITTPHFIEDKNNKYFIYSDNIFHSDCFNNWEYKNDFIELFNNWKADKPNFKDYQLDTHHYDSKENDIDKLEALARKWEKEKSSKNSKEIFTEEEIKKIKK